MAMSEVKKFVVIGGVAGGASAAARARRLSEDAEIIVIERGEYVSFANCGLPYHIGGTIPDRNRLLVQTPATLYANLRIDVRTKTEAIHIDRERKEIVVRKVDTGAEERLSYDKLVLSPGAEPVRPSMPGADDPRVFTLRSMADMDAIIRAIRERLPKRALVVGGGYIGLEMAEALIERGLEVTLVELLPQVMGTADPEMTTPLNQQLKLHGVDLRLETSVTGFKTNADNLIAQLSSGDEIECGIAIMAVGVRPEIGLAVKAGLAVGERGGIVVDEHLRTSDPDIYAVGDAIEVRDLIGGFPTLVPLAGPANRQGRIAADNAFGRESTYRDTQGTAICKVFDLAVGITGMSEKALKKVGMAYEKVYVHPASHASYYPGASPISLKLLYDPKDGRILGAQAVGADGVDKRIDVLATALRAGLTVFDLEHLELSYAPPFGSAKDAVNYAGFVAANAIRGDVKHCYVEDVVAPTEEQFLLDVRKPAEVAVGTIPGSINIPLDELRDRIDELPQDRELLVFCQVGLRGYLACRILSQRGFRCRNLAGGMRTYTMTTGHIPSKAELPRLEACDDAGMTCAANPDTSDKKEDDLPVAKTVDARGLQCPGPILRLASEVKELAPGQAVEVLSTDPAFVQDVGAWCHSTGNHLVGIKSDNGFYRAVVAKGQPATEVDAVPVTPKGKTIIVFSNDFDRVVAAFVIANGAAAMGSEVTMFFTFWGINVLRKQDSKPVKKNFVEKMFGRMMPRGANALKLSKMNIGGIGLAMIKGIMRKKNVASLPELIASAQAAGVKLVVCTMSMDLMGIKREELIDGIEEGGVATYLDRAQASNVNLFI
jgi:NADPH-dependent 2,4-dienoyl-CoA reductase/sulfur reductase-like enzyme/peroxiredoxin family protein/TusA-related sulfurtransferase/rhodanese-related sulfurtransferase